jgi:hypothetical protein
MRYSPNFITCHYVGGDTIRFDSIRFDLFWLINSWVTHVSAEGLFFKLSYYRREILTVHLNITYYEGRLQSSWTHFVTPTHNFVEVRWRSLFRSTSLGKRCTSYNAPPTLKNVLQTFCRKLQEDSGTGGFDLLITSSSELPFHGLIASSP